MGSLKDKSKSLQTSIANEIRSIEKAEAYGLISPWWGLGLQYNDVIGVWVPRRKR